MFDGLIDTFYRLRWLLEKVWYIVRHIYLATASTAHGLRNLCLSLLNLVTHPIESLVLISTKLYEYVLWGMDFVLNPLIDLIPPAGGNIFNYCWEIDVPFANTYSVYELLYFANTFCDVKLGLTLIYCYITISLAYISIKFVRRCIPFFS